MSVNNTPQTACPVMYPELYYKVQPTVSRVCREIDINYQSTFPDQETVEKMTDYAYQQVIIANPDLIDDNNESNYTGELPAKEMFNEVETEGYHDWQYQRSYLPNQPFEYYNRQRFLREFTEVLLINELFRRRRIFF